MYVVYLCAAGAQEQLQTTGLRAIYNDFYRRRFHTACHYNAIDEKRKREKQSGRRLTNFKTDKAG